MKLYVILILNFIMVTSFEAIAQTSKVTAGFKSAQQFLTQIAMIIGPIAFIVSGIIYYKNKMEGADKFSGAVIGTAIIGGSSILYSVIYGLFN